MSLIIMGVMEPVWVIVLEVVLIRLKLEIIDQIISLGLNFVQMDLAQLPVQRVV